MTYFIIDLIFILLLRKKIETGNRNDGYNIVCHF